MSQHAFRYRAACGWLRDLAAEPTPHDPWPCIRWDDRLLQDQIHFLTVQAEAGVDLNVVWGLFVDRAWPVPLTQVIHPERADRLATFVGAAHARRVRILAGTGVYSWGFDEVIARHPEVSAGHRHAMCPFRPEAWDWQRRVLDLLMDPRWGLDGVSLQSADQGRCECEQCARLSPAEHHARVLVRCAQHIRAGRPDWIIGTAAWGLRVDQADELPHIQAIGRAVDYLVEVQERSARAGVRADLVRRLSCALGSVGGVFVEPPQHWDRLRWFLPCGLRAARSLQAFWADGGRACEHFYRPFANPVEEVSWRTAATILSAPETSPEAALREASAAVYGVAGAAADSLADWFSRAEDAYFSRANFQVGDGPLSLEPLVWEQDPAAPGPPVYLRDRLSPRARADYARELAALRTEFGEMDLPHGEAAVRTTACMDGTLREIAALA